MDYARALRIARAARGVSQAEVAKRARLDASYVSRIEAGVRSPRRAAIESISAALMIPAALLDLLASPADQLVGINQSDAAKLGTLLIALLSDDPEEETS